MRTTTSIFAAFAASVLAVGSIAADQTSKAEANAEANAEASGNQTSTHKKTVTVTSDGKRTIRRIVEVRDGVESVTTEIIDENGRVSRTTKPGNGDEQPGLDPDRPWLGVRVKEASEVLREQLALPEGKGAVIEVVAPDGPADKAGIVKGDLLLSFAETPIDGPDALAAELQRHEVGDSVELEIMRRGETRTVKVTLEKRPANQGADDPPPAAGGRGADAGGQGGKVEVEIEGPGGGAGFDNILNDPNLPEDFKNAVREMQRKMRDFEKRHGIPGGQGAKVEVEIDGAGAGAGFDSILNNPNLPDKFKDTVREMQERMRDFERRHGNR